MESLRYLPFLSENGYVVTNTTPFIDIPFESIENGIRDVFGKKGEDIVELNLKALRAGREFAEENK
jgi:indolepyruvate ferredoxin oxidoreductase beta subunit